MIDRNLPQLKDIKIELSKRSFWEFCKTLSPDFYKESRTHLKTLCETLQAFYDDKLGYDNLAIQMPPRHGKSRTLINFSAWMLGKEPSTKIITASYNDDLAQEFSMYTRNVIQEESNDEKYIVYSDIFNSKVKHGDASYKKWALEGQHFSYKGAGVGGSLTGRGGNLIIVDDPIKDAETAYNESALDKIWRWYSGTLISRQESKAKKIVCATPWAKQDLMGRLIKLESEKWFILTMPAIKDNEMLCPELLSREKFDDIKAVADENIFLANYMMERPDIKGRLYNNINTYDELPKDKDGNIISTGIINYTDTADEGDDYLASGCGIESGMYIYLTDVLYTKEPQEVTEPQTADMLIRNNVKISYIESNNGGRGFARNVRDRIMNVGERCYIKWFYQSRNKKARILTEAPTVMKYILFPKDWAKKWPEFYRDVMTYQKEGKNKHDDGPDMLTGLVEKKYGNVKTKVKGSYKPFM